MPIPTSIPARMELVCGVSHMDWAEGSATYGKSLRRIQPSQGGDNTDRDIRTGSAKGKKWARHPESWIVEEYTHMGSPEGNHNICAPPCSCTL